MLPKDEMPIVPPLCQINRISEATYEAEWILTEDIDRTIDYMEAQLDEEYKRNLAEFKDWICREKSN